MLGADAMEPRGVSRRISDGVPAIRMSVICNGPAPQKAVTGAWEGADEDLGSDRDLVPHFRRIHAADRIFPEQGITGAQGSPHRGRIQALQFPPSARKCGAKALAPRPGRVSKKREALNAIGSLRPVQQPTDRPAQILAEHRPTFREVHIISACAQTRPFGKSASVGIAGLCEIRPIGL